MIYRYHTSAPVVYDGFSTTTLAVVGRDKRGNDVREVSTEQKDLAWQTGRYDSGLQLYTSRRVTLEDFVRFGDWFSTERVSS